jgi:RHS repeat-associated protein
VANDQRNEVGHVIHAAFGQIVANTIPLTLPDRLFTGQILDQTTGLYYYHARYYDPFAGQFTQPDSLVADPLNPAAWNRFSYVHDSPTTYVDPSGHNPLVVLALVAGVGGLVGGAAYISQHPFDPAYILEHPTAPQSLEFYKAVVGGELLAASLLLPFNSSVPTVIRGAVIASHISTWGSDVRNSFIARDRTGIGVFLPRSSWEKYLGNAVGAVATAGLLHYTTCGPVSSAVAGAAARRLTINLLETNSVDPWEVGIDAAVR